MAIPKFERPRNFKEQTRDRLRVYLGMSGQVISTAGMAAVNNSLGRFARVWIARKIARGETVWLDDIPGPPLAEGQKFEDYPQVEADLSPNTDVPSQKSHFIVAESYPPPVCPFAYRKPPLSGMVINGLGETEKRRPRHLFFGFDLAWGGLMNALTLLPSTRIGNRIADLWWDDRRRWGVVSPRQQLGDPVKMTADIKAFAKASGAALVGITTLSDEHRFEGFDDSYKYAVSIAVPMDREEMQYTPSERSYTEIFRIYREVGQVAIKVAAHIRSLGYPALACTNIVPDSTVVLHIPIAIQAGLGQLGKYGSMITKEYGSNVRLATILTDLPLILDAPVDLGVDDFCLNCKVCTTNCPPHAIFETKQIVRGEEKWYVNFDKCVPYFASNETCGICIEVCPWSTPGGGVLISEKMLGLRGEAVA